ncbi:M50 family metallopeptidase [Halobacillus shinanisalinarum]|uniref:M50 family metallopeptidase n=1 Tax=Halobacillus shinanisalinarum TaxID=2932258 RepID=A0ABY4H6K4_9BACI|nr:M50 family metallopeptidase [Halobacillus shinanisalinarum]UOQ95555.1 M50 family metallopeptidase [Halobacillus shinanisalinarum]
MKVQIATSLILALLLTQAPIIGKYFAMINTMIHESGHSLMALLTGGEVRNVSLFSNTSGVTMTGHTSWFSHVLTSLSGYLFSSLTALLFFHLIVKGHYQVMIFILMGFLAINLLFWVRNFYGVFWLITFGAAFIYLLKSGHQSIVQYVLIFIASLILVEAVMSAFTIMRVSFISPSAAGDAANLAHAVKFIPSPIWGIFFFAQSLYLAWLALKKVFVP